MITLDAIRRDMKTQLKVDKGLQSVDVNADTLEDALADAAIQLDLTASNLEYEVVEKGSQGLWGISKRPWKIRVYQSAKSVSNKKDHTSGAININDELSQEHKSVNKDGMFYVRRFTNGLNLKVTLPEGEGTPAALKDILASLKRSDTTSIDENLIRTLVKDGTGGEYVKVGTFAHTRVGDALIVIEISNDEMHANLTATAPAVGGCDISADQIENALVTQGVAIELDIDRINDFVDNPIYNTEYEIMSGIFPADGRDAYIAYQFETDPTKLRAKEDAAGQMNFKELNKIQNVVAGQPLAQKMLAEKGKAGKTLYGRYLEAKNGKDISLPLGKNVSVDSDGCTIVSNINGQVLLVNDKINVEPVLELDGINIKTGNITFLGSIIVKGSVDDGFSVKASGNIEISGTVGKSNIEADGNIIVSQGVFGHDEGSIVTGGSLWAKFIQATKVEAAEYVMVSDSIMNSNVTAMKRIILRGKKAQITGGHLFATEEICARNIGSPGGTETILEVGFDPKAKQRLKDLQGMQAGLMKELEENELDLSTLENQKKIRRTLPKDKEENLSKLKDRHTEITEESAKISEEIQDIQNRLRELKVMGKVKAEGTVYSGVKIYVRDVLDEIRANIKNVTFYFENNFVRRGKYEPPNIDDIKGPDGYSTY
ncbi:FapA family protein [Treponema parvum]|uniref:FapA family protein n=1 Tax=Treponema parvum TaxID=138851 RepID=A0A975EZT2_9SPIR|nr:FapA family protein [Treponema parvum]QTQ11748.1 FapA family protein [Treponema parvum]